MTNMNKVEMNDEMLKPVNGGQMSDEDKKKCMDLIAGLDPDSTDYGNATRLYSTLTEIDSVATYENFYENWYKLKFMSTMPRKKIL